MIVYLVNSLFFDPPVRKKEKGAVIYVRLGMAAGWYSQKSFLPNSNLFISIFYQTLSGKSTGFKFPLSNLLTLEFGLFIEYHPLSNLNNSEKGN